MNLEAGHLGSRPTLLESSNDNGSNLHIKRQIPSLLPLQNGLTKYPASLHRRVDSHLGELVRHAYPRHFLFKSPPSVHLIPRGLWDRTSCIPTPVSSTLTVPRPEACRCHVLEILLL